MLDASDVKRININRIRSVMWRGGEHTKQSVARATGLSVATCNTFLNEMEYSGEITSDKRQLNGVGRSTGIYRINEAYESILCIRIDLESDGHRILGFDVLSMLKTVLFHKNFCYKTLSKDAVSYTHLHSFFFPSFTKVPDVLEDHLNRSQNHQDSPNRQTQIRDRHRNA